MSDTVPNDDLPTETTFAYYAQQSDDDILAELHDAASKGLLFSNAADALDAAAPPTLD